jgi:hypothetical protein
VVAPVEHRKRRHGKQGGIVKTESGIGATPSIEGNMIDLGAGNAIAIYERNGVCWVAEFYDGHGKLEYAGSWFRFHAGRLRAARAALKSTVPLTPEMLERIECLHRTSEAREQSMLAVPRAVAAAAQRYLISVISRLRESKISQTLG